MGKNDGTVQIQELIKQLAAGNEFARDEIIVVASQRLRVLTAKMLRGFPRLQRWEQTDDIFQTAVMKLHRTLKELQPASAAHFFNLAATQIRRTLIDLCRRHFGPLGQAAQLQTDGDAVIKAAAAGTSHGCQPASLDAWTEFHEMVGKLPASEKAVFEMRWYGGLRQQDVAACLEISLASVKRRWRRAKLRLHNSLVAIAREAGNG